MTSKATEAVRDRYNRWSSFFDFVERLGASSSIDGENSSGARWKATLSWRWEWAQGEFPLLSSQCDMTAIDLSEQMLKKAVDKAKRAGIKARLEVMDVQDLRFQTTPSIRSLPRWSSAPCPTPSLA